MTHAAAVTIGRRAAETKLRTSSQNIETGQTKSGKRKKHFDGDCEIGRPSARWPSHVVCHVPARFEAEHNRNDPDRNSTDNRERMQTSTLLRKEFDPAEINCCRQPG